MSRKYEKVTVLIPTRNRWDRLLKTLESIPDYDWIDVCIVCDDDRYTFEKLSKYPYKRILNTPHRGAVYCRNLYLSKSNTRVICATDDIEFCENSIENAMHTFEDYFPNEDGVVGFVQTPHRYHPAGVVLVGQAFLRRFPDGYLYCPYYYHFACQEILWYCDKVGGLFISDDTAKIIHHNPTRDRKLLDNTHKEARKYKKQDEVNQKNRKSNDLIWGL